MKRVVIITEKELETLKRTTLDASVELHLLLKYMEKNMEKQDMGLGEFGFDRLYGTIQSQVCLIDEAREVLFDSEE